MHLLATPRKMPHCLLMSIDVNTTSDISSPTRELPIKKVRKTPATIVTMKSIDPISLNGHINLEDMVIDPLLASAKP